MRTSDTVYDASASSFADAAEAGVSRRAWLLALGVWAVVACFNRLGAAPVVIANEAREGVYARAMLATRDFIAPRVANHVENGELVPDKPPLFHWLAAGATWARAAVETRSLGAAIDVSRRFDEWSLRFPSALAAAVLVLAIAVLGSPLVGERAALFAAASLLTTTQFWYQARFGRVDMLLACFTSLATLLAGRAILERRHAFVVAAGACAGFAVLAKGPLGAVLPALACASYVAFERRRGISVAPVRWTTALAVAALVALPWYVVSHLATGGATLRSQIFAETLTQFLGPEGRMPELFYLQPWLLDSLPWNLVAAAALVVVWRRSEPGPRFCALWWLSVLVFFQIAAYKRRAYLLPALPAEALLAGWLLDRWVANGSANRRRALAVVWLVLGAIHLIVSPMILDSVTEPLTPRTLVRRIESALPAGAPLSVCGIDPDPTLPLLFYARDPEMLVVGDGPPCIASAATSFYLLSPAAAPPKGCARWRESFRDQIRGWKRSTPVVFGECLEAVTGPSSDRS